MKKLIFVFFLLPAALFASEWPIDSATQRISIKEVVQQPGSSSDELFVRTKGWTAKAFNSAKDVIQVEDKDAGLLVLKGLSEVPIQTALGATNMHLRYRIKLDFKDGRYRYEITDLEYTMPANSEIKESISTPAEDYLLPMDQEKQIEYSIAMAAKAGFKLTRKQAEKSAIENKDSIEKLRQEYNTKTHRVINGIILSLKKDLARSADSNDNW